MQQELENKFKTKSKIVQQGSLGIADNISNNISNERIVIKKKSHRYFPLILLALVVLLGLSTAYFYNKSVKAKNPDTLAKKEAESLAMKVGKLIVLPTDEVPTIATVSDPEALKNQSFFVDAKKGDKVLIYTNAKKAILYDPVLNKIITVAPLNIGDSQKSTKITPTVNTPPEKK